MAISDSRHDARRGARQPRLPDDLATRPANARDLITARVAAGLTQLAASRLIGIERVQLVQYESGKVGFSERQRLRILAAIAKVDK